VTKLKQADEALRESENRLKAILDATTETMILLDRKGIVYSANQIACDRLGTTKGGLVGKTIYDFFSPNVTEYRRKKYNEVFDTRKPVSFEDSREGMTFEQNAYPILGDGDQVKMVVIFAREITERKNMEAELKKNSEHLEVLVALRTAQLTKTNERLADEIIERKSAEKKIKASLDEKSVLLSEIHHRVRNNLQIISSLLDMTRRRSLSDEARGILAKARSRIFAMALIHSQLYESEKFNRIDMDRHLQSLLVNIHQIYGSLKKRISPVIECSDVYLSVAQATPCALVFNEAISNVYKHAYKEDESGPCYISMKRSEDNRVFARVRDEGVGIPESVNADKIETLGLKLLRNLVLHQLKGKFRIEQNGGTDLFFEFDIIHDDELIHSRH